MNSKLSVSSLSYVRICRVLGRKKIIVGVIKVDLETKKSYLAKEVFSSGLEAQTNNFDFPLISCLRLYVLRPACL